MVRNLSANPKGGGRFDLGVRQAVDSLLPGESRDAIVFFTSGILDETSFARTSLSEIGALLQNNGIRFFAVVFGDGVPDAALKYLVNRTGGTIFSASRPGGLNDLARILANTPSGTYRFSYISAEDSDFGNRQMSVSVEGYLFQKSGRDELGYYAPLR
jgi:hypothetical protein